MREVKRLFETTTIADGTDRNVDFSVPKWATGVLFFFNVSAMSGTTETLDIKLQHLGPYFTKDVLGANIVQLVAAADILMTVDPRITAAANIALAQALSSTMRLVCATGFGGADESYTFNIIAEFYS